MQAVTFIFQVLGTKCVPFIKQVSCSRLDPKLELFVCIATVVSPSQFYPIGRNPRASSCLKCWCFIRLCTRMRIKMSHDVWSLKRSGHEHAAMHFKDCWIVHFLLLDSLCWSSYVCICRICLQIVPSYISVISVSDNKDREVGCLYSLKTACFLSTVYFDMYHCTTLCLLADCSFWNSICCLHSSCRRN